MYVETYPTFFTPRDEEPSLSSSEEKSLEFDQLEIKRMRKQKQSKCSVFYFLAKLYKGLISENKLLRSIVLIDNIFDVFCKGNYKLYIRGYSPLRSYLKTKESYDRWVTRRLQGFRQQISKAKYLKISQIVGRRHQLSKEKYLEMQVANIWKLQENTAALCKMAALPFGQAAIR